jgi:hypothetical protein
MPQRKRELTRVLLRELDSALDLDAAMNAWYVNIRESGGMRLTDLGYRTLRTGHIASYRFTPDKKRWLSKQMLLDLDRGLDYPYYIDRDGIEFFSSRDAVMVNLYGDLEKWLQSLVDPK